MFGYDLATDVQNRNIVDIVESGAEYCIFNCHGCQSALSEKVESRGIKPVHMVDLCRLAIGENPEMES
jgi:Fe-S oxidoreductase